MSEPSHTTDQPTRHHSTNIAHPTAPDAEATGLNRLGTLRLDGKRIGLLLGLAGLALGVIAGVLVSLLLPDLLAGVSASAR